MTKKLSLDEGEARPVACPAEAATAGEVGFGNTDNDSGRQAEVDQDDDDWSPVPGRTWNEDVRVGVHEAGHAICARLLGRPLGGATVDPGPGYEGRVWGERHMEAFTEGRGDASDVREVLAPLMPSRARIAARYQMSSRTCTAIASS